MSIKLMSYVWDIPTFKGSQKLIMLCLADFANDDGYSWPKHETIARKCGVSVSTVKSTLQKLSKEETPWLTIRHRFKKEGGKPKRLSNLYILNSNALKMAAYAAEMEVITEESEQPESGYSCGVNSQNLTGGGSESGYRGGQNLAIDPPIDPPIEPLRDLVPSVPLETGDDDDNPVLFKIPLKGKANIHSIHKTTLHELEGLYPNVDIAQQLRNMIGWSVANPTRQKTKRGVDRFIHAWLSKEQDRSKPAQHSQSSANAPDFHSGDTSWANGMTLGGYA